MAWTWTGNQPHSASTIVQFTDKCMCLTDSIHYTTTQHYNDVIIGVIASEIPSFTIVYSIVYSGADQREHLSSAPLAFVRGKFPAQMASNAENVSIWWRHHEYFSFATKWMMSKIVQIICVFLCKLKGPKSYPEHRHVRYKKQIRIT